MTTEENKKNNKEPLKGGMQPERKKGVQPSQDLDISNPPSGGSGVSSDDSSSSNNSSDNNND